MPRKTYRPEEIIAKLREAEVLLGQGARTRGCAGRSPTSPSTSSSCRRRPGETSEPLAATQVRRRGL